MRGKKRNSIEKSRKKLPQFTTMNVMDGQVGLVNYTSLIFYSLTIDNILNIVILIILATITINFAFGEEGLIARAEQAKELTEQATRNEQESLNSLMEQFNEIISGNGEGGTTPEEPEEPSEVEIAKENGEPFDEKTTIEDEHKNKITVPEGFKIAKDSGDTVQEGIVIEDAFSEDENVRGSQYVWIPVGTFIKDDKTESNEIVLGRYTFANDVNGTPTLQQAAYTTDSPENYKTPKVIETYYSELATYREGVASSGTDGLNATAYNLEAWVNSVKENGGYYIGRYEASFASGSSTENYKAASKVSTGYANSMSYTPERLWNNITQLDASKVAINTYKDSSKGVKSDLINSYAWDTAIVYIQEAGNTNYANKTSANRNLSNTGTNGDEVCKINDMASNCLEWTTEYSSYARSGNAYPCVVRGGNYGNSDGYTAYRDFNSATFSFDYNSFRLSLYIE